ncbi:MAG: hypothetical protein ACR5K2_02725 [Wolbachia sp.]
MLQILEKLRPSNNSLLGKEYLQKKCIEKRAITQINFIYPIQQPSPQPEKISHKSGNPLPDKTTSLSPVTSTTLLATKTTLKPLLKIVFFEKDLFYLLLITSSISTLYLQHLPLGKASILKGLVHKRKEKVFVWH